MSVIECVLYIAVGGVKALFHVRDHVSFIAWFSMGHQSHPLLHTQIYNEDKIYTYCERAIVNVLL